LGIAGASAEGAGYTAIAAIGFPASKNPFASSLAGVMGLTGDDAIDDESGVVADELRKLRSMVENSESLLELIEEPEEDEEILRISGAVRAWTFVVEISSVGRDMRLRLMVPAGYRTVIARLGGDCGSLRLARLVTARARAFADEAIANG